MGGRQVATVKRSTSLRMKKRGNVPPRLDTLENSQYAIEWRVRTRATTNKDLRCEQSHICSANRGVRNTGMEGRNGDEHDGIHECGDHMLEDDGHEIPEWDIGATGVNHHSELGDHSGC